MSDKIYVYSVGMTKFGKFLDKSIKKLTGEVLKSLKNDGEIDFNEIEAAWFSNSSWGMYQFQHSIRGQVALSANKIDKIPIINVENACASGSTAFHGAWMAIKSGLYDCVLAIGAEKIYQEDRKKMMGGFITYTDVEKTRNLMEQLKKMAEKQKAKKAKEGETEEKKGKKGGHSAFMDLYAMAARNHMKKYGTTKRQLAVVAAKNHNNSTLNPLAQYTFPMTVEEVMEDYEVSYPLTRSMCAPVGDGAAAAILCSEKFLKEHRTDRAALIRASVLKSGSWRADDIAGRASETVYKMANISPQDINVAEVHDATAFGEIHQIEQMGFCPIGQGGPFTESGATALDGKIPVNPSGGLLSRGHPIGASGLAQIYELIIQLRGEAEERQVKNPRFALAENGGGNIGFGEAALCVHILEKI
ncbi:MAG: thiolase family protein [Promethearchaeota archaeon]|nr:MAG: thiolase family protein [Candidatus Lokiarchaeota archaeon]